MNPLHNVQCHRTKETKRYLYNEFIKLIKNKQTVNTVLQTFFTLKRTVALLYSVALIENICILL